MNWTQIEVAMNVDGAVEDMLMGQLLKRDHDVYFAHYAGLMQYPFPAYHTDWTSTLATCQPPWFCMDSNSIWQSSWLPLVVHPIGPHGYKQFAADVTSRLQPVFDRVPNTHLHYYDRCACPESNHSLIAS